MSNRKKRGNPYKEANEAFLAEKAKEEGMVVLESGIMYRRLKEGPGAMKVDGIPAHSALIFEIELVMIERV